MSSEPEFSAAGAKITVLVFSRAVKKIADRAKMSQRLRDLLDSASAKIGDARYIGDASGIGFYRYNLTFDEVASIVRAGNFLFRKPLPGLLTDEESQVLRMCVENLNKSLGGEFGHSYMRYAPKTSDD